MLTIEDLKSQIESHSDGMLSLEDLAAWAEDVFREEHFEQQNAELLSEMLATIRDAVDPHRFRWEEPDFAEMWERLEEAGRATISDSPDD